MNSKTKHLTFCAFFAALLAICSQIQIPLPLVPINLALFAVHLSGTLLGAVYGPLAVFVYVCLGAVGAPVFAGFSGGVGILTGATGGYIVGYILCAWIVGLLTQKWGCSFPKMAVSMVIGVAACYALGTAWFMFVTKNTLLVSLTYCVIPFLPGDVVKIILAGVLTLKLKKPLASMNLMSSSSH